MILKNSCKQIYKNLQIRIFIICIESKIDGFKQKKQVTKSYKLEEIRGEKAFLPCDDRKAEDYFLKRRRTVLIMP